MFDVLSARKALGVGNKGISFANLLANEILTFEPLKQRLGDNHLDSELQTRDTLLTDRLIKLLESEREKIRSYLQGL